MKRHLRFKRATMALAMVAAMTAARGARAGDVALAESLFRQGKILMNKGKYAEACPKLAESFNQDPGTGTLFALAVCQEQLGRTASAWASFSEVIERAQHEGRADRVKSATESMHALEPKLSHLTIQVDAVTAAMPGLVVTRDGTPIGSAVFGVAAPLDPGDHAVEAVAPGKRAWKVSVQIGAASDSQTVKVALEDEPAPNAPNAAAPAPAAEASSHGPPLRMIGLVVGGVGVVALGVSAYFGLHAASLDSDSKNGGHCDGTNACDAEGLAKRNDAVSASNTATIALLAGGTLAAVGATLFIVGRPGDSKPATTTLQATPTIGPGVAAMLMHGRF